jgi:hypothetical protein
MADPKLNVPVQGSSFPSEPSYRMDEAIERLYQMGYITAVPVKKLTLVGSQFNHAKRLRLT